MTNTVTNNTNINLLTKAQYDTVTSPATDELWAVEESTDSYYKNMVVGWGMPDYSSGITITSGYIANRKGLATVSMNGSQHMTNNVYINEIKIGYATAENSYQESPVNVQIPLDVGDKISWQGTSSVIAMFFPYKGV